VTRRWLVTAGHCLAIDSPRARVRSDDGFRELTVVNRVRSAEADVALFEIAEGDAAVASFEPMAVADGSVTVEPGSAVELAGYGVTESGDVREERFLTETVVEVSDDSVVVDGFGASGACSGDSGGPLLVRDGSGRVRIAGVLSTGSGSCLERDRYARLDVLADFIASVAGEPPPDDGGCGELSGEGRCLYGSALHCDAGTLVAERCDAGTACGWDGAQRGFRCVRPANDPCLGVDSLGACRDGAALVCHEGTLDQQPCACDEVCRIDGETEAPGCSPATTPSYPQLSLGGTRSVQRLRGVSDQVQ
jgi:hypothetical protein